MVEVFLNPALEKLELPEIDYEAIVVHLIAPKDNRYSPIVAVNEGAMPIVEVLAMRPGNISIGFSAGNHTHAESFQLARTRSSVDAALSS